MTWILWNISIFHCSFLKITKTDRRRRLNWGFDANGPTFEMSTFNNDDDNLGGFSFENNSASSSWKNVETGLFTYTRYDDSCVPYDSNNTNNIDSALKASRFFGVMGLILNISAFFLVLSWELCLHWRRPKLVWLISQCFILTSLTFALLTFSIFGTDICQTEKGIKCGLGAAGIVHVVNILFIIGTFILSVLTPMPKHPVLFCRRWNAEEDIVAPDSNSKSKKQQDTGDKAIDVEINQSGGADDTEQGEDVTD